MICSVDAPEIEEVLTEFKEWVGDAIFVAHNASFDMGFIDTGYERLGFGTINEWCYRYFRIISYD